MAPKSAILTGAGISTDRRYLIIKQFANGVVVGSDRPYDPRTDWHVAIHRVILTRSQTLHPVVGEYRIGQGWIFPNSEFQIQKFDLWLRTLRMIPRLEWDTRLARYIVQVPAVKVAIEDWSPGDLNILRERAWFVGWSAHAPLWRIYAKIPVDAYEGDLPVFDGQPRRLERFGAIYDPRQHKLSWKLEQE